MNENEGASASRGDPDAEAVIDRVAEYDEGLAADVRRVVDTGEVDTDAGFEWGDGFSEVDDDGGEEDDSAEDAVEEASDSDDARESADAGATTAELVSEREERIDELEAELQARDEEIDDLEARLKRKQADFQNFKKRAEKKRERIQKRATEDLVERLLGVRDDLRRGIENDHPDVESLREGVEMVLRNFDRVLEDEGVAEVDPDPGEEVDPERHEVMMRVDSEQPEDTVAEVFTPGYEMGEKVIQAAKVTVSTGPAEDADEE
jgi:molecular chaperone GrpE